MRDDFTRGLFAHFYTQRLKAIFGARGNHRNEVA